MARRVRCLAGGAAAARAPLFSGDRRHVFMIAGGAVVVYGVGSGDVVATLRCAGTVTGIARLASNPRQLVTASVDGAVQLWDYEDGMLQRTVQLGRAVTALASSTRRAGSAGAPDTVYAAVLGEGAARGEYAPCGELAAACAKKHAMHKLPSAVVAVDVRTGGVETLLAVEGVVTALVAAPAAGEGEGEEGAEAVVAAVRRRVYVFNTGSRTVEQFAAERAVTCVAVSPVAGGGVALGDAGGRVTTVRALRRVAGAGDAATGGAGGGGGTVTSERHWHAHAVAAVAFSSDGSLLLSGGEEAVLVLTQVESGAQTFLPRLGAPVTGLAVPPAGGGGGASALVALVLADASLALVDAAAMALRWRARGLAVAGSTLPDAAPLRRGPVVDPRTRCPPHPRPPARSRARALTIRARSRAQGAGGKRLPWPLVAPVLRRMALRARC